MRKTFLLSVLILGAALLWGARAANAQCVTFVPTNNVIVSNNGFAFQQFGSFGTFVPTNNLFFTPAFGGSNVIVANRNVIVAQPRRQVVVVRNGLFGQRVTVIR